MKKSKQLRLLELAGIRHRSDIITEGDDLFGGGDEGGDDAGGDDEGGGLFGDDEGGDEGGDDEGGEDTEEGGDEEGEEAEEEEPEEPAEKLSDKEIADHGPGEIDTEIDGIMQDLFSKSLSTAKVKSQTSMGYPGHQDIEIEESLKKFNMAHFLFEGEEAEESAEIPTAETVEAENFDLAYFTGEVARYIKNYETLMDMEGMIYNKAKQFMLSQFGEEMGAEFDEKMKLVHDISFTEESQPQAPIAVGATAGGGGGV